MHYLIFFSFFDQNGWLSVCWYVQKQKSFRNFASILAWKCQRVKKEDQIWKEKIGSARQGHVHKLDAARSSGGA